MLGAPVRDFTKMAERSGASGRIGDALRALAHQVRDGTLSRSMFACHMLFLRHRIETLLQEGAAIPRRPELAGISFACGKRCGRSSIRRA